MRELIQSHLVAEAGSTTKVSDLLKKLRINLPDLRSDELFVPLAAVYPLAVINSCAVIIGFKILAK